MRLDAREAWKRGFSPVVGIMATIDTFALLYIVLILRVFIMQICKIIFDKEKLSQNWINFVRNSCFPIIRAVGYKY